MGSLEASWHSLNTSEAILEALVDFRMEISVIVARGADGTSVSYVPVHRITIKTIYLTTQLPRHRLKSELTQKAE